MALLQHIRGYKRVIGKGWNTAHHKLGAHCWKVQVALLISVKFSCFLFFGKKKKDKKLAQFFGNIINAASPLPILRFILSKKPLQQMWSNTYLKHLLSVVVFGLEQLAPGGQVAIGEDAAGLQQPVSVTLQTERQHWIQLSFTAIRTRAAVCATNEA